MNNFKLWIHIALLTTTMLIVGNASAQETANIPATNQVQLTQPSLSAPIDNMIFVCLPSVVSN